MTTRPPLPALLERLRAALGPRGVVTDAEALAPHLVDWRGLYRGRSPALLRPADTAELARAVRLCAEAGVALVPQGGNTSMVGGAVPDESGTQLVLSLARLDRVRGVDPVDLTLTVEAGATLKAAQEAAEAADCFLPLSIGAEGTAEIGGVLSTNAGGILTLRYGNARDLVLGLEVVLADGTVWNGLRRLRKDNTGYCLRQLFVGAEGTLGVITAAVLKLAPAIRSRAVGFVGLASAQDALALYRRCTRFDPAALHAFEFMNATGMELVLRHIPQSRLPLAAPHPCYVLVELASPRPGAPLAEEIEEVLADALAAGEIGDATVAASAAQTAAIWRLRETHPEAGRLAGAVIRNDVSVPVSAVPAFLAEAEAACRARVAGLRLIAFGHLGDGNIHFNLLAPEGAEPAGFLARMAELMDAVNDVVRRFDGSFSAEHGIGRLKTGTLAEWRAGTEIALMRRLKAAFDPAGVLNPGKLLACPPGPA